MNGGGGAARVGKFLAWAIAAALLVLAAHFLMKRTPSPPSKPALPAEPERVAAARLRCGTRLRAIFENAGLRWPAD
jgi:hypothetical protein